MTSYPKVTHSFVNVIIVTLYLACVVVGGGTGPPDKGPPRQDLPSNDAKTPHFGIISPIDPYPLVGETVRLNCTVLPTYPGPIDVNNMHFKTKDHQPIRNSETRTISNNTVQLIWHNVTADQNGYVYCYMGTDILNGTNVNIGFLPPELTDEDLDCYIYNGQSMDCTWCPNTMPLLTQWKSSFSVDGGKTYVSFLETSRCSSHWPSRAELLKQNLDPGDEFKMNFVYYLWVDTINVWSNNRNINPKHIFELDTGKMNKVKPNRVHELTVTVVSSTSLDVVWERPRDLPASVAVYYELTYTSEWNNDTVYINGPGVGVPVAHTLDDLHPFTKYDVSVRCKPRTGGFWSEHLSQSETTSDSAPSAAPEMARGSYKINPSCEPNHHKRCDVIVIWKEIDAFNQNGIIHKYVLEVKTGGERPQEIVVPGNEFQATVSVYPSEAHTAILRGHTRVGHSPPSVITITFASENIPTNVVAEINENKTNVDVWWDEPSSAEISSYTLFYCTLSVDDNQQPVCGLGDLTSVFVGGNSTNVSLPYSKNYMYSFAANTDVSSSGMQDWLCLYVYNRDIPDVNFIFTEHQLERSLTIGITTDQSCDPDNPSGRILNYNISIQCGHHEQDSCQEAISHVVSWKTQKFVFENLEPYKEYNVTVTAFGNSDSNTRTLRSRTLESAPDSPPVNVTIEERHCHRINISWSEPPKEDWNGNALMYKISYMGDDNRWLNVNTSKTWIVLTDEIYGDINYVINVTAANNGGHSESAPSQSARTSICAPLKVTITTADILNSSQVQIKWDAPEHTNGPLAGYQIMAFYETLSGQPANQSWSSSADMVPDKFTMDCPENIEDYIVVNYSVRAVTYDKATGTHYLGPLSSSTSSYNKHMCKPESFYDNLPLAIGVSVASAVCLVFGIVACTCRQKWYPEFKRWLGGGVPEEPPIPDMEEKPDDLTSISTEPPYIDDWVKNLIVDLTPLIDENSRECQDDDYIGSGESARSTRSRIFIEGIQRDNSGNSSSGPVGRTPSSGESAPEYMLARPDNVDEEDSCLVQGESHYLTVEDPTNVYTNGAFTDTDEKCEEQSESSGIQSGKESEIHSKNSSCASSGIGQEQTAKPLGASGIFATLTAADLDTSDSDDDGYREVGMTRKRSCPNDFSQFEDHQSEDTNYSTSAELDDNKLVSILPRTNTANYSPTHRNISDCTKDSLGENGQQISACVNCHKMHGPHMKCCATSPELSSSQGNRQNRIDSTCSEGSIPLDILKDSPGDFSIETAPSFNTKRQNFEPLGLNSNATSC